MRHGVSDSSRCGLSKLTCTILASDEALSMWFTHQAFCITLQTRVQHSRTSRALRALAGSLLLASTTPWRAFLSAYGASSHGSLVIGSFRSTPYCATEKVSLHAVRHGCKINISIPKSTVTPWLKCRAGFAKTESNTYARTRAQCCVRIRMSCSLAQQTTGALRDGWRSLDGLAHSAPRVDCSSRLADARKSQRLQNRYPLCSPPVVCDFFMPWLSISHMLVHLPEVPVAE